MSKIKNRAKMIYYEYFNFHNGLETAYNVAMIAKRANWKQIINEEFLLKYWYKNETTDEKNVLQVVQKKS